MRLIDADALRECADYDGEALWLGMWVSLAKLDAAPTVCCG